MGRAGGADVYAEQRTSAVRANYNAVAMARERTKETGRKAAKKRTKTLEQERPRSRQFRFGTAPVYYVRRRRPSRAAEDAATRAAVILRTVPAPTASPSVSYTAQAPSHISLWELRDSRDRFSGVVRCRRPSGTVKTVASRRMCDPA